MTAVARRARASSLAAFLLGAACAAWAAPAEAGFAALSQLCAAPIKAAESRFDLPGELLMAVAMIESGRWDSEERRTVPWPWTVYAEGRDRHFETKEEAVAEVERLRARGVSNIDVGCMQVNLRYHPKAFASLEEAFAPERNVEYAARFLLDLFEAKRSWANAVAAYHSSTPEYARPYREKFVAVWNQERRRMNEVRRLEKVAELEKRRSEREREREAAKATQQARSS